MLNGLGSTNNMSPKAEDISGGPVAVVRPVPAGPGVTLCPPQMVYSCEGGCSAGLGDVDGGLVCRGF